jgi:hypothetical protein
MVRFGFAAADLMEMDADEIEFWLDGMNSYARQEKAAAARDARPN